MHVVDRIGDKKHTLEEPCIPLSESHTVTEYGVRKIKNSIFVNLGIFQDYHALTACEDKQAWKILASLSGCDQSHTQSDRRMSLFLNEDNGDNEQIIFFDLKMLFFKDRDRKFLAHFLACFLEISECKVCVSGLHQLARLRRSHAGKGHRSDIYLGGCRYIKKWYVRNTCQNHSG
jgi:hypothetical protein